MGQWARRRILGLMAGAAATPWLAGCASGGRRTAAAAGSRVELLYLADTLDQREPGLPAPPPSYLGPASLIGTAPWITGPLAASLLSPAQRSLGGLLDAAQPDGQRYGGYAVLSATLERLRQRLGPQHCLTLENGQCWNGSGLAYLTQGRSGVQGSRLLASEVRVSSDERLLWPHACSGLYREYPGKVVAAGLSSEHQQALATQPFQVISRSGVRIAVVGVVDPHAPDNPLPLSDWLASVREAVSEARRQAELVVVMADVGTGASRWLAQRLPEADVLLGARGQDFWPRLIQVPQADGRLLPVCLAGSRGLGVFQLECQAQAQGWRFQAYFHPALEHHLDAPGRQLQAQVEGLLRQQRAAHSGWLDQPLARAPCDLWRRDSLAGSWDSLIAQALRQSGAELALLPGLRYDSPLRRGQWITREHLLRLSGGHVARVTELPVSARDLQGLLEQGADHCFGEPLLMDNSQDLPRLSGLDWQLRYTPEQGARVADLPWPGDPVTPLRCATFSLQGQASGQPLWQVLEQFLRQQPLDWQLPPAQVPSLAFVEGHPGWHPRAGQGAA